MNDFKLVPVKPTPEMERAAESYWNERRFMGLSDDPRTWAGVYQAMLAAAPAVQGEPVLWWDGELQDFDCCVWKEQSFYHTIPLYAAPQPTEQQPDVTQLVEALERARDRLEGERRSGEFDPLIRDIDDALSAYRNQEGKSKS